MAIETRVGKIVPMPDNKAAILINGLPHGNVFIDTERKLCIELCGQIIKINPSGTNGKMTSWDKIEMKIKVAEIYQKYSEK